jgi:hypothetical protein
MRPQAGVGFIKRITSRRGDFDYRNRLDLLLGEHPPINPSGAWKSRIDFYDLARRDDGAERDVVLGHRHVFIDDLQRMNRSDDRRLCGNLFVLGKQGEFQVRIAAAFTDSGAAAIHGDRAADDQVDLFDFI